MFAAARTHSPWTLFRMAAVFIAMVATTIGVNFLTPSLGLPEWSGTAAALLFGAIFYVLLVWELNGPLGRAVVKYLSGRESYANPV